MKSFFLLLSIFLFCTGTSFAYPENWIDKNPVLLTLVYLEGVELGEVWINPDGNLAIDRRGLIQALKPIIEEDILKKIKNLDGQNGYFLQGVLHSEGIEVLFNPNELTLDLVIPRSSLKIQDLELRQDDQQSGVISPQNISSYLNFDASQFQTNGGNDYQTLYNTLNLNYKGLILNSGGFYNSNSDHRSYRRDYSRMIFDDEQRRIRFMLGDVNHKTTGIQESFSGAGVSIQNEFSIQPELLNQRYNNYELELKKPSQVEIFLNNARIYVGQHGVGRLNLRNLPLILGMNTIEIIITDSNGRRERVFFNSSYHQNVLPQGIHDYSLSLFNKSEVNELEQLEYDDQKQIFSGFYKYGLTPSLTGGLNFQSLEDNRLYGLSFSKSFLFTMIELELNQACQSEICHRSSFIGLQSQVTNSLRNFYYQLSLRNFENKFTAISGAQSTKRNQLNANSVYILNSAASLGVGYEKEHTFENKSLEYASLEYVHRFNGQLSLSSRIRNELIEREDNSVLFTLTWNEHSGKYSGFHSYDTENKTSSNQVNLNQQIGEANIYASGNFDSDQNSKSHRLYSEIDTIYGGLRLSRYQQEKSVLNQYNLRFSLLAMPDFFGISRYINSSYLVLATNTDSNLYVINEFQSSLNRNSALRVTDLTPYRVNRFQLDINELELDESINQSYVFVRPSYLSGSYHKIDVQKVNSLAFKLISSDTELIQYAEVTLRNIATKTIYKTVSGKNGFVFIENFNSGTYQLNVGDKSILLEVPSFSGYKNIGSVNFD